MLISAALRLQPKDVVALTGGGGKTTLMFRVADELVAAGQQVVTTMTTKIFIWQMALAPAHLVACRETDVLAALPRALAENRHVLVVGGPAIEKEKVQGIEPALLDSIMALPLVGAAVVEADGSRQLPFKAPADFEPMVPAATTVLVPVAGMDAVGAPLTAEHVHRPELVGQLAGAAIGDQVTPEMIAAVLAHPQGGAKGLPPGCRCVPFLNKADDQAALSHARLIARLLLQRPHVDSVVIGAAQARDPVREVWGRAAAVVLAAGGASRFGALKQVLPWEDGLPLVARAAATALACPEIARVAVTAGAGEEQVRAALEDHLPAGAVRLVRVPDWEEGQSRSVRAGLAAVLGAQPWDSPEAPIAGVRTEDAISSVLFLLADQPDVSSELLTALVQRHRETLAPVVAPRHRGIRGNPVLFDRATFAEFAHLAGDAGARPIIQAHRDDVAWVDWPTAEVLRDIDTPDDLQDYGRGR